MADRVEAVDEADEMAEAAGAGATRDRSSFDFFDCQKGDEAQELRDAGNEEGKDDAGELDEAVDGVHMEADAESKVCASRESGGEEEDEEMDEEEADETAGEE